MTDRDALLKVVLANPDDDLPRLMYADAIEDAEPQRAEFIRVQVELARGVKVEECPEGCDDHPGGCKTDSIGAITTRPLTHPCE